MGEQASLKSCLVQQSGLDVMLKNVLSFVSSCGHSAHRHRCGFAFAQPFARSLSTNSAINKGLRKSRHGRSRLDPPARLGRFARKVDQGRNIDGFGHGKSNFEPQSRLSIDEQMPTTTRKGSLTLRQRRILQLKDRALAESRHESPNDDSSRNQRANSRSSTTLRLQNQSRRIGGTATKLNRAERRAAAFGHKMNPPEGYKALPITVEKQPSRPSKGSNDDHTTARRRLSSSWRTEHNDKFAAKDWDGNVEESSDERPRRRSTAPLAIPYTTPASEFLYGHSVVTTALKYSRRSFYKLYLYSGDTRGQDRQVRKMALAANVEVTRVGSDWLKLMDKMSGGRPHNGYVLEASPLPKLPVTGLQPVPNPQSTFDVALGHQSREEEAVNGRSPTVTYGTGYRRYPFLLLLDGIRDPGNMGAIFRSAYFLGADGIILCTRHTAALSPVTLKAAAGAAESLPILSVDQPGSFIENSQKRGWKFYAAVSPSSSDSETVTGRPFYSMSTLGTPTQQHPCILVLGSEGEGLRWNVQKKADFLLGIEAQRTGFGDLDSLNVSVTAALLCHAFLKKPETVGKVKRGLQEKLAGVWGGSEGREDMDKSSVPGAIADEHRLF